LSINTEIIPVALLEIKKLQNESILSKVTYGNIDMSLQNFLFAYKKMF